MTKWYRACVNYIHSVPEYNCALEQERFTEKAAIAAIHKLKHYYDEKHFVKRSGLYGADGSAAFGD